MDRETVIETIVEIAESGRWIEDAKELLDKELRKYGYSSANVQTVIDLSASAANDPNIRRFAAALCDVLFDKTTYENYLNDPETLHVLCVFSKK